MRRTVSLQAAGPILLIATFVAAETAARMLEVFPASAFWWFVNLEVFRPLLGLRFAGPLSDFLFHPAGLWIALVLLAAVVALDRIRARFALAVIANLGAIVTAATAYLWFIGSGVKSASLAGSGGFVADGALVALLVLTSMTAALASHVAYLAPSRRRRD